MTSGAEQLLIEIGADISGYKAQVGNIKKLTKDLNKSLKKNGVAIAKQLAREKIAIEKKSIKFIETMQKNSIKKQLDEVKKSQKFIEDMKRRTIKKEIDDVKKSQKFIEDMKRRTIKKQLDDRKRANDEEVRLARKKADKISAINRRANEYEFKRRSAMARKAAKSSESKNWDFSGHRDLLNSALVVAKYGAISQALYGVQNAFRSVATEIIHTNDRIYQNMAVLNKTREEAIKLTETVGEIGRTYGGSLDEVQEAMITLGRAGVDTTEVLQSATKVMKELALITGDDMRDGAEVMSSFAAVFGIDTARGFREVGNQLAYIANETRLGVKDFSTISNYALSAAKSIGLTKEAYLALNGMLSKVGKNASTIGTSIRRFNKIMHDDSKANINLFKVLGFEQKKFAEAMSADSNKALGTFIKQIRNVDPQRYTKAVSGMDTLTRDLIDGLRSGGKYFDEMLDKVKNMDDGVDHLGKQAATMANGITISFEKAWNTVKTLGNGFADLEIDISGILPIIKDIARAVSDVTSAVYGFIKSVLTLGSTSVSAGISKNLGKGIGNLTADINELQEQNKNSGGLFGISNSEVEQNNKLIEAKSKQISKLYNAEYKLKQLNKESKNTKVDTSFRSHISVLTPQGDLSGQASKKELEYIRKKGVEQQKLNGTYKRSVELKYELTSLQKKLSGIDESTATFASGKHSEDRAKIELDIAKKQLQIKHALASEEKKASGEGAANARAAAKAVADEVSLLAARAELRQSELQLQYDEAGILMTKYQTNLALEELYKAQAIESQDAADKAKKIADAHSGNLILLKKYIKLQTKANKDASKYAKQRNKEALKFGKAMQSAASSFADALVKGDFKGAMKGMLDDVINIFVTPMKDLFVELFGKGMTQMFGDSFGSLTDLMSKFASSAVNVVGSAMETIGLKNASAAIAAGGATASFVGAAAMAALMAGIGLAVSGFSGGGAALKPIDNGVSDFGVAGQGLDKIMEDILNVQYPMLKYARSMDTHLSAISNSFGGITNNLLSGDFNLGGSGIVDSTRSSGTFGQNTTTDKLTGTSLIIKDITVQGNNAIGGQAILKENYQSVATHVFSGDSTTNYSRNRDVSGALTSEMQAVALEQYKIINETAQKIGVAGLNSLTVDLSKIDMTGLSETEQAQRIKEAFSSAIESSYEQVFGSIDKYRQAGETYIQAATRLVTNMDDVGEMFNELGSIMNLTGMKAISLTQAFIDASGGIDEAMSNVRGYIDNFYTEEEKQALRVKQLQQQGLTLYSGVDAYKEAVAKYTASAARGNESSARTLAALLRNQDLYRGYYDEIARKEQELADQKEQDLQDKLDALEKERELLQQTQDFYKNILNQIETAYTGSASYLNSLETAAALEQMANIRLDSGDSQGYFDTLYKQLDFEKKTARTREEYAVEFDSYINELKGAEFVPEKTTDDVVESIDALIEQNRRIEDAITQSGYQAPLSNSY